MLQNSLMNAMNDQIRPERPIPLRIHLIAIPCAAFEKRSARRERSEPKLAVLAHEETVQVRGVHVAIWAELEHWWRLLRDVKSQSPRLVPDGNWLHKRAGGELTAANRADAAAIDPGALRASDAEAKIPITLDRQVWKRHDIVPHGLWSRIDF